MINVEFLAFVASYYQSVIFLKCSFRVLISSWEEMHKSHIKDIRFRELGKPGTKTLPIYREDVLKVHEMFRTKPNYPLFEKFIERYHEGVGLGDLESKFSIDLIECCDEVIGFGTVAYVPVMEQIMSLLNVKRPN